MIAFLIIAIIIIVCLLVLWFELYRELNTADQNIQYWKQSSQSWERKYYDQQYSKPL